MEKNNISNCYCKMWALVILFVLWMPAMAFSGTVEFGLIQNTATFDAGSKQISGVMDVVSSNASESPGSGDLQTVGQIAFEGNSFTMNGYAETGNETTAFSLNGNYAVTGNDRNNMVHNSADVQLTISTTANLGVYASHGLPQITEGSMHTFWTRYAAADSLIAAPTDKLVLTSAHIVIDKVPNAPSPPAVPIPSAAWLLSTGIIGLWGIRRRTGR